MRRKWPFILLGALAGAALIAAACAPASEETTTTTETTTTPTSEKPELRTITKEVGAEVATAEPETAGETKAVEETGPTSVSGIPLDPDAKRGGILRIGGPTSEGPTFSTWEEAAGVSFWAAHPISNMMIQTQTWGTEEDFNNLAFFNIKPDLATDWEISEDGLQYTFHLRDGIEWSDGVPFTCADAKWSFDTIRTGEGLRRSPRAIHLKAISDIQCVDDLTLVMNLSHPKSALLEAIAMPYNVIRPKHIYENDMDALREDYGHVGTGPYRITDWLPGEKYTFERRDDYWDQPLPYLDGITLQILGNQALDQALRAGRLDISSAQGLTGPRAITMLQECKVCKFYDRMISSSTSPALGPCPPSAAPRSPATATSSPAVATKPTRSGPGRSWPTPATSPAS